MDHYSFELSDLAVDQNFSSVTLIFLSKTGEQIFLKMPREEMKKITHLVSQECDFRLGNDFTGTLTIARLLT